MVSLITLIKNIPERDWNYYQGSGAEINKLTTFDDSNIFIRRFFSVADKEEVLNRPDLKTNTIKNKHSVSAFFLGSKLAKSLSIRKYLFQNSLSQKEENTFLFVWFLTCLFHDWHWDAENSESFDSSLKSTTDFIEKNSIKHVLLKRKPRYIPNLLWESVNDYFKYRLNHWKVIDHGIAGGLILFDELAKNRIIKESSFSYLDFSKSVENQYKEAAYAVATHNIFLPREIDKTTYINYGLERLISQKPIHFYKYPYLFLLGLVDTLEPLKTYCCVNPNLVANHVHFEFTDDLSHHEIKIKVEEPLSFSTFAAKKGGIENWLALSWDNCEETKTITIRINKEG